MTPKLALVTSTETVELPLSYIPEKLFSRAINTTILRNQDDTEIIVLTDGLPKPHFFEFSAQLRFETDSERHEYTQWLHGVIDDTVGVWYLVGQDGVILPVNTGWLSFSIGTSNPIELDVMMKLLPTELEWVYYEEDSARMYRDDITMSNADVTWETLTYPRS